MKRALIIGVGGQDGYYLGNLLLDKGYEVFGCDCLDSWQSDLPLVKPLPFNLNNQEQIRKALSLQQIDEIYNLAAISSVAKSFAEPLKVLEVNFLAVARLLDILQKNNIGSKFYQASSGEMFGNRPPGGLVDSTIITPASPYGVSKLSAYFLTKFYRECYQMYVCNGILFNHESPRRPSDFVTRKITIGVAGIAKGLRQKIELGNINVSRDWGFACDYVEAMWLMLQQDSPDDYVIATGEKHTIKEFVVEAFRAIDREISWRGQGKKEEGVDDRGQVVVSIDPGLYRPLDVEATVGDYAKAKRILGWQPKTSFSQLVKMMVESDLDQIDEKNYNNK